MSKPVSLMAFTPTEDELKAARQVLARAYKRQHKSVENAMGAFLKGNPGDGNAEIANTAADNRSQYIEKYLCYQTAKKPGRLSNSRSNIAEQLAHP